MGAFCRTYSIADAIDTFLPDVYKHSSMPGRYDYIPADSQAGVVLYEDKFAYSHHATDPACGKLMNAFDVVRIHKFGSLDAKSDPDTDPAKLPSFKAMQEFAVQDECVKMQLAKERVGLAQAEFDEEFDAESWQTLLELDKTGKIKDTLNNIANIIRYDPNLKAIVYNEFKSSIDVIGDLPWTQVKPGWADADVANAKLYFERVYGIWSPTKFKDALLAVVSAERQFHPIKDYFATLQWDGTERLDTLLIDYLGADDTPYVRAVTRKTLTAAVARVYEPGIKFDSILVLNGPQGVGKSTFFSLLGRQWYSDSLSISDMKDKTAAEKLQGYWILELGELAGIKKVDVETVKSFVTRTDDKFRQSYGIVVESHPRTCIIVGSTNSEGGFLRDITGNRRFWPVHVSGKGKHHPWEMTEIDQIWAEAIKRYRQGEELFLSGAVAAEAYARQQDAMESDDREGIVADYCARFLQRVCLLFDVTLDDALLPLGNGPLCGIAPIRVFCQNGIRVQKFALHFMKYELPIGGGAGPVHQTAWLIGGIIEELDADLLCDFSGYRTIFVRRHLTGQRNDQAQSGLLRRVFMGAVEIALEGEEYLNLVNDAWGGIVHIQRKTGTGQNTVFLPATAFQSAEDKAAHILDVILFRLTQLAVLLHSLGGTLCLRDAVTEFREFHLHRVPLLVHSGITDTQPDHDFSSLAINISMFRWVLRARRQLSLARNASRSCSVRLPAHSIC